VKKGRPSKYPVTRPFADDDLRDAKRPVRWFGLSLFWRTFFMLSLLMVGSVVAAVQTARALHFEPLTQQTARQIASLVKIACAALAYAQPGNKATLIHLMAEQEQIHLQPRNADDVFEPLQPPSPLGARLGHDVARHLAEGTVVASQVNGTKGLWISVHLPETQGQSQWWLRMDQARLLAHREQTWLLWLCTAGALSLAGAVLIARFLNKPLQQLSYAAGRVRDGDFDNSHLDESVLTSEIRAVNTGFNSMAQKLAKMEHDRAVMLAGISHDLRTPLARLRLETEMSVADPAARDHMVADIVQLDAIIDKFLEYARPSNDKKLAPIKLYSVVTSCIYAMRQAREFHIALQVPQDIYVMADEIELARVISNVLENARRYGKDASGLTRIHIAARARKKVVQLRLRDHGPGVPPEQLANLIKPFFRSDSARTAATGAGLGLSIVDKTVQRMGGVLTLTNSSTGGLVAHIQLARAAAFSTEHIPPQRLQRPRIKRRLMKDGA